jgi:hypothetical protein
MPPGNAAMTGLHIGAFARMNAALARRGAP